MQHNSSSNNTQSVKQMQLIKISWSFTHLIVQREIQKTNLQHKINQIHFYTYPLWSVMDLHSGSPVTYKP